MSGSANNRPFIPHEEGFTFNVIKLAFGSGLITVPVNSSLLTVTGSEGKCYLNSVPRKQAHVESVAAVILRKPYIHKIGTSNHSKCFTQPLVFWFDIIG